MSEATPPAAPAPAAPAAPAAHGIEWLPQDADPDLIGHAQNAAWKNPADAVKAHRELQKLFGADRHGRTVVLPKDDAPAEEWSAFHDRLGRPGNPVEYGIQPPEGGDPAFAQTMAQAFHEVGLTKSQAQKLAAKYAEFGSSMTAAQEAAQAAALEAEHAQLQKDWGTGPDAAARRELARRAAVHLGLDERAIDALEKVAGFSKTMKALAKIGDMTREAGAEGVTDVGSFSMTPEGAKARRSQLMADADWRKKASVQGSAEWAELTKINRVIASVAQ